jgi:glycerol-3-phosphate acyltransferase PlsY
MVWPVGVGVLAVFVGVLGLFRIVSLSSIAAAIATPVLMVVTHQPLPYVLLAVSGALFVILRHRSNIERMLAGIEPRLGGGSSVQEEKS